MGTALLDGFLKMNVGEGAFYAVFGFAFVFCGIAVLIAIFSVLGLVMKKLGKRKQAKAAAEQAEAQAKTSTETAAPKETISADEGLSPQTVAAITAAVAAVLSENAQKCDFIVKRIKRL